MGCAAGTAAGGGAPIFAPLDEPATPPQSPAPGLARGAYSPPPATPRAAAVGAGPAVVAYAVDRCGTIREVRTPDAWRRCAEQDGAPELADAARAAEGRCLFDCMQAGPLRDFYRLLTAKVGSGELPVCSFRWFCEAPQVRRELLLVATREEGRPGDGPLVVFHQCLLGEQPRRLAAPLRAAAAARAPQDAEGSAEAVAVMCAMCSRFQTGAGDWLLPEAFYTGQVLQGGLAVGLVSHKFCPECARELDEVRCCIPDGALVPEPHPTVTPAPAVPPEQVRMCIVDDDAISARVAAHYAKQAGYRPVCFYHPGEALEHMLRHPVHLLATDIVMPGLSGLALMERLRSAGMRAPVIGMSGSAEFEGDCLRAGMAAFLLKPLGRDAFTRALAAALAAAPPAIEEGRG